MPGLIVPIGGGRFLGSGSSPGLSASGPATIAQTAYGAGDTSSSASGVETWHVVTGSAVASLAFLAVIRHSLPGPRKQVFDLIILVAAPVAVMYGTVGVWARKRLNYDAPTGVLHGAAAVVKALTP
jgi:hypothetical protein